MPKRVKPGDPLKIPASDWNALMDLLVRQQRIKGGAPDLVSKLRMNTGVCWVKQMASGSLIERFSALAIHEPMFEDLTDENALATFKNQVLLKVNTPLAPSWGKFVITLDPLGANAIGRACISGVCVAKVMVTKAAHEWADITPSQFYLKSGACGNAKILWKESGTSVEAAKWAIVQLGNGKWTSNLKLFANASGGGKYAFKEWLTPTTTFDASTDLTEAEIGIEGESVRVANVREVEQNTHDLDPDFLPLIVPGTFLHISDDGVPVYSVDADQWEDCTDAGEIEGGSP